MKQPLTVFHTVYPQTMHCCMYVLCYIFVNYVNILGGVLGVLEDGSLIVSGISLNSDVTRVWYFCMLYGLSSNQYIWINNTYINIMFCYLHTHVRTHRHHSNQILHDCHWLLLQLFHSWWGKSEKFIAELQRNKTPITLPGMCDWGWLTWWEHKSGNRPTEQASPSKSPH